MKTYRITEEDIKGMPILAVGYKMFTNDWTAKSGNYAYKDENGNIVGTIHKVDGDISECKWGLHFSEKPQDCFNFYESVPWNRYAKVEAYGSVIRSQDGKKSVAQILKIIQTYTLNEFITEIQQCLSANKGSNDIMGGNDIRGGNDIWGGNYIRGGNDIRGGNGIRGGNYIWGALNCEGISRAIFCYKKSGKLFIFNKKTTEERFNEVYRKLLSFEKIL